MDSYEKNALAFNEQLTLSAVQVSHLEKLEGINPDALVIIGMGGSGLAGTLLQNLANDVNITIPVIPWKNFGLPELPFAKHPLYLFVSFSGDTKEVLDGFSLLEGTSSSIAVVAGGGELLKRAQGGKIPHATFKQGSLVPRQSSGIMCYGSLALLKAVWPKLLAPDLTQRVIPESLKDESKRIAKAIASNNVFVYANAEDSHLAYFWKIHLNETGKTVASWHVLPEMNHNEIVGFSLNPKNCTALFLEGEPNDERAEEIRKVTEELIEKAGTNVVRISARGSNRIERTFNSLALGSLVALEVAKIRGVDPKETDIIQEIKKRISKFR